MNIQELNMLELNFEGMKRILTAQSDPAKMEEVNKEKQEQMAKNLKEQDFDELMKHSEPAVSRLHDSLNFRELILHPSFQHDQIQNKLNDLFNSLALDRPFTTDNTLSNKNQKPIYEKSFPELFFF